MTNSEGMFIVGFLVAVFVFLNADPDVKRLEIEEANAICESHQGVGRIKTNVFGGAVAGVCGDGPRFSQASEVKR